MLRRRRTVFAKPPRAWPVPLAGLLLFAGIAAAALYLTRPSNIDLRGTFTMFQPLRCQAGSPGSILHTSMEFERGDGRVVGRVTRWASPRMSTETVRGFVHCREVGSYRVRLPKEASYVVALPSLGRRFGPVSLERLVALHYRYDVFYCCGP